MPITTELGLLADDAVLGPAAAPPRELVVATGVDRIRFLHGLVTGDVAGTEPGQGCRAVLLTTKGQVVNDMRIFVRPNDVRIVVDAGQAAPLASSLGRYAIMDDFAAAPVPEFSLFPLLGPAAPAHLAAAGVESERWRRRRCWRTPRSATSGSHAFASSAATVSGSAARAPRSPPCARGWRPSYRSWTPLSPRRPASTPSSRASASRSPPTTSRWRSASPGPSTTQGMLPGPGANRPGARSRPHQLAPLRPRRGRPRRSPSR